MPRTTVLLLALTAALLSGCGGDQGVEAEDGHGGHDHNSPSMHGTHTNPHEEGSMPAVLPEGANATCPVMGGGVDATIFTEYQGRTVYFCCEECIEKFEQDPDRYFAKAYPDDGSR